VFIRLHPWYLPWAQKIQSTASHPVSWRFISILSAHLERGPPNAFFAFKFSDQKCVCIAHPWLDHLNSIWWNSQVWSSSLCNFLWLPVTSFLLVQIFSTAPCSQTLPIYVYTLRWETKLHTHTKQQGCFLLHHNVHVHVHVSRLAYPMEDISLEVRYLGCDTDLSLPSSPEVKYVQSYTFTHPCLHSIMLN
jgi:hypothetical protein